MWKVCACGACAQRYLGSAARLPHQSAPGHDTPLLITYHGKMYGACGAPAFRAFSETRVSVLYGSYFVRPRARGVTGFIAVEQPRTHTPTCSAPHSALGRRHTHTHTVTHTPVTDVTEAHTVTDRGGRHSAASPITNITDVTDVPDVTDVAFHEETRHEQHLSERAGGARAATMTSSRDSGRTPGAPVI